MKKLRTVNNYILICFWIFVLGSVFGFFAEMMYGLVYTRTIVIRKGLIYGPFIQIYGMGAVAYYFLTKVEQNPKQIFFKGMIMGGVLEYLASFLEEIFFHSVSWEYSGMLLNLNGRTSIQYCIYWGLIAVFFLKVVYPGVLKLEKVIKNKKHYYVSYILMIFMAYDIAISSFATQRRYERKENIPPKNSFDAYLDAKYPDELIDRIYNNKRDIPGDDMEVNSN